MASLSQLESDEAFARQLQAQENGEGGGGFIQVGPVRVRQAPRQNQRQGADDTAADNGTNNPTVLNARMNNLSTQRATVAAIVLIHIPQIIAAIVILTEFWDSTAHCDSLHRNRWKWWSLINSVRMLVYTFCVVYMHAYRDWLRETGNHRALHRITSVRNTTDAAGLVWFVVGNMWIFGDTSCHHQIESPIYNLCLSMLVISYVQICLPCILAAMLIPVFCFCMPCLIRVLASVQERPKPTPLTIGDMQGATEETIAALPTVTLEEDSELIRGDDNTCPICLSDMVAGERVRILHCKHFFHNTCVDEWLKVNASCPTCRESILTPHDEENGGGTEPTVAPVPEHPSDRRVLLSQGQEEDEEEEERRSDEHSYSNLDIESVPLCP